MKALLPAQLLKVASKADRTYSLTFNTRELLGIEATTLLDNLMNEGWLLWSPNDDVTEADIPTEKADAMLNQKTQAQRLRSVIFILWQQNGSKDDFEAYYRTTLERIIDQFKAKLD